MSELLIILDQWDNCYEKKLVRFVFEEIFKQYRIVEKYFQLDRLHSLENFDNHLHAYRARLMIFFTMVPRQHSLHRLVSQVVTEGVKSFALSPPQNLSWNTDFSVETAQHRLFFIDEKERKRKIHARICATIPRFLRCKWSGMVDEKFVRVDNFEKIRYLVQILSAVLGQERIFEILYVGHLWQEI